MELLFELLVPLLELIFELVSYLGGQWLSSPFRRSKAAHPILAFFALLAIGLVVGACSLFFFPERASQNDLISVSSLFLNPALAAGVVYWLSKRRKATTDARHFATPWGAATFVFGVGLSRYHFLI